MLHYLHYGKELILDLHHCNPRLFTRFFIQDYLKGLCKLIDMEAGELFWWDDLYSSEEEKETEPHLIGTSAVQFIKTSNITIHTLDVLHKVYLNVFSCKDFDENEVATFSVQWFEGKIANRKLVERL